MSQERGLIEVLHAMVFYRSTVHRISTDVTLVSISSKPHRLEA